MSHIKNDIQDLYLHYRDLLPDIYKWEDEKLRWVELVYCIFSVVSGKDETQSRSIVSSLNNLNLLESDDLAACVSENKTDMQNETIVRLLSVLSINGIGKEEATKTVISICEAAKGIQVKYKKLQIFLRIYGDKMLKDLSSAISFSGLDDQTEVLIYTTWLQNVMEMPIPLENMYTRNFCKDQNCTVKDLIEEADAADVNVAVIDDLIRLNAHDLELARIAQDS